MNPIFVDTGAWFARFVPSDPDHAAARAWFDGNTNPLLTTDYILDELLTLLKGARRISAPWRSARHCSAVRCAIWNGSANPTWPTPVRVFSTYGDKGWSFTDCISREVMERLGIRAAVAFDDHFRQFGTVVVLP